MLLLNFIIALLPATMLAAFVHEAGHAIAARCIGFPIYAWGIGHRRPWYYHKFGATTFYLGLPLGSGLTVCCQPMQENRPIRTCVLLLGGPLASILGLGVGLCLWPLYSDSPWLLAWLCVSAIVIVLTALPIKSFRGSLWVENDACQILDCLIHKKRPLVDGSDQSPAHLRAIADLLDELDCKVGFGYTHALIAIHEATVGSVVAAQRSLSIANKFQYYDCNWVAHVAHANRLIQQTENSGHVEGRIPTAA